MKSQAGFYLPDYRGRFLRGVNQDAEDPIGQGNKDILRDPDAGNRLEPHTGGWSGNAVGSIQYDALQKHEHSYNNTGTDKTKTLITVVQKGSGMLTNDPSAQTKDPSTPGANSDFPVRTADETRTKKPIRSFLNKV